MWLMSFWGISVRDDTDATPVVQEAKGRSGMVTSPHPAASAVGQAVLKAGGTAIEAAVAMGAMLSVVYPHFCGLGGDAVWLIADEHGQTKCLMGIGQATENAQLLPDVLPLRGPLSAATTACVVDSWDAALTVSRDQWGGQQSLADLLAPAIDAAEGGFPLSQSQSVWLRFRGSDWPQWSGFGAVFDTRRLRVGRDQFRQPNLAQSLREIARHGAREFYEGGLAQRLHAGLAAAGAPITLHDLAITRAAFADPVGLNFGDMHLLAPPAPTQGVTTLAIMGLLERLGIAEVVDGSADFYHLLVEAVKEAFLDRPNIMRPDHPDMLGSDRLDAMSQRIARTRARAWTQPFQTGDTVFLGAVDACGRAVSVLQSIYFDWGSGVVAGDTGVLWQNRAAAFNGLPGQPDRIRAGAWPFYTLNPGLGLRNGKPALLYGTQGADGQPQTLAALLARVLAFGHGPAQALAAPRFLLGRTFADSRDSLKIEKAVGSDVLNRLSSRGHMVAPLPDHDPLCGQAGIISIGPDGMKGAHDPRSDGVAMGV